ncbi:hypothetical protein EMIHUDRAFT_233228 [Emiliania huxleyi CCMP1516]|uniref:Anaphase-promoting complex subunit 4 WD40 domain-containing protein n=2 Tax=Emiliania huxleyi TaxID=2903 RepID=A0A0D3K3A1_EMIH1|nr:hypothetical protein EMIHUDRAFT_233228 [Emiliania huxleyi CCMP1516]EOD30236.1 hypothetical protein EMIHUDRAFT_233228 [Emiliania huxleyi CCMP1516]|eukprot:XP_005782665.1 hypothetical protein EMIHUDRAFT_233228 [Emiliania huxleyi CCMP1516]
MTTASPPQPQVSHSITSAGTLSVARSAASLLQPHSEHGVEPTRSGQGGYSIVFDDVEHCSTTSHAALRYTGSAVSHADDGSGLAALRRFGREPDAPCKVPNTQVHALTAGAAGASAVAFSADGALLAAALADPSGRARLAVYHAASGALLRRPADVCLGRRHGEDGGIRLWDGRTGVLVGSAVGHGSRVNAVVWSADGGGCYSADALGAIKFWEADWRGAGGGGGLKCIQTLKKEGGAAVDSLSLHPSKRRLLVQLRSGALIGLDTRTYHFSTRYVGHSTGEYHVRAGYSPDGRLVFSGDAKGGLHVWVEETGAVLLEGRAIGLLGPLLQVAWSPVEHLVACAAFGPGNALITLAHDSRRENSSG